MEYLFISDIEGCEKIGRFNKQPQNTTMCDPAFYLILHNKLVANKNLHVCFLGDYFDQGQGVINSIIGISFLKSSEEFGDRVHIILGNRDINKFRIYFEKDIDFSNNEIKRKMDEIGYSSSKVSGCIKDNPNNMMKWMADTMGVEDYANACFSSRDYVNCRHGLNIDQRINEVKAYELLLAAFEPSNFVNGNDKKITKEEYTTTDKEYFITAFKKAICILYCKGNIVELIKDKKILLSHSGGHTPYIHKKLPDVSINEVDDYFTTYLEYKKKITPNNLTQDIIENETDIEKSVNYHREIYSDFIENFQSMSSKEEALKKHIQLQCMGMPKVDIGFITPCDKKPAPNFKFDPKAVPYGNEVQYVAHGHTNFGLSFPIIYKYHNDGPTYIACDTSVGNRPKGESFKMNYLSFGENKKVTMGYKEYDVNEDNQGVIKEGITYGPPVIDPLKIIEKVVNATPHQRGGKSRRKRKSKRRSNKTKRSKKRNTKKRKTIKRRRKSRRNKKK